MWAPKKPTKRRSRKRETHTCHWIDIIIGITWNTCKSITFCMTILCTECRSKSKIQKHTASHSINLLRRYLCACAMCVCLRVLANSKCIYLFNIHLFGYLWMWIRKHTHSTQIRVQSVWCWLLNEPHLKTNCDFQAQRICARSPPIFYCVWNELLLPKCICIWSEQF